MGNLGILGFARQLIAAAVSLMALASYAQTPREFDACAVLDPAQVEKLLGAPPQAEVSKAKVKPKFIPNCQFTASKDGRALLASLQVRFARGPGEASASLREARIEQRGKPMIISGQDAFWNEKLGALQVVKGNAWLTVSIGSAKPVERTPEAAKQLAESVLAKL